jgi:PPP family 3-phenylpropionic acid transporter
VPHKSWPRQSFNFSLFFFAYYGYIGAFTPYASLFFADKGMSAPEIALLMSLMQVMRIFGPNLWGWVADHTQKRAAVLRLTAMCALACFLGMFVGKTFAHFFVLMTLVNTFTSAQGPISEALVLSEMRGDLTHYGRLRLWGSVGFIAAVTVVGELLDWRGIGFLPWVVLMLLVLIVISSIRIEEPPYVHTHHDSPSVFMLLKQREVIAFFVSTFLMIASHSALYVFYSLYLSQLGYSKTVIGLMWSLGVVAEIVFFFYQAPIFRRFGVQRMMMVSLFAAVVRFCAIGLFARSLLWLLFAQLLHAATFGVHHSASVATLQRWFSGPLQARGQAIYTSISYGLGGTLGGLILSVFWDELGARAMYFVAAALAMCGVAAAALSYRWQPHQEGNK